MIKAEEDGCVCCPDLSICLVYMCSRVTLNPTNTYNYKGEKLREPTKA
jgi:hypothetical protein